MFKGLKTKSEISWIKYNTALGETVGTATDAKKAH